MMAEISQPLLNFTEGFWLFEKAIVS